MDNKNTTTEDKKLKELEDQIKFLTELIIKKKKKTGRKPGEVRGRKVASDPLNETLTISIKEKDKKIFYNLCKELELNPSELIRAYILDFNKKNKKALKDSTTESDTTDGDDLFKGF